MTVELSFHDIHIRFLKKNNSTNKAVLMYSYISSVFAMNVAK